MLKTHRVAPQLRLTHSCITVKAAAMAAHSGTSFCHHQHGLSSAERTSQGTTMFLCRQKICCHHQHGMSSGTHCINNGIHDIRSAGHGKRNSDISPSRIFFVAVNTVDAVEDTRQKERRYQPIKNIATINTVYAARDTKHTQRDTRYTQRSTR